MIGAVLLIGSLLLLVARSGAFWVILFLLVGLSTLAWVWTRHPVEKHPDFPVPGRPLPPKEPSDNSGLAGGSRVTGKTVRIEDISSLMPGKPSIAHLVVTGDGPPRDVWYGKNPDEPWPSEVVIGRSPAPGQEAVLISSKAVSAIQARLLREGGSFLIENLSQTNMTRVAGRPLEAGEKRPLADGDRIEMGPVTISYRLD